MKKLTNVQLFSDKLVATYMALSSDRKPTTETVTFSEARAAVVMPVSEFPGYFLIMGREVFPNESGRNPLRFMMEGEQVLHDVLFEKLTNAARKCRSMVLYAKQERTTMGMEGSYRELWQYIRNNQIAGIRLMPAPSSPDIEYGKTLIREYLKADALSIPKGSILINQLKDMEIVEPKVDDELYAFHALRFLLAGFSKSKNMPRPFMASSSGNFNRKNPGGWT